MQSSSTRYLTFQAYTEIKVHKNISIQILKRTYTNYFIKLHTFCNLQDHTHKTIGTIIENYKNIKHIVLCLKLNSNMILMKDPTFPLGGPYPKCHRTHNYTIYYSNKKVFLYY